MTATAVTPLNVPQLVSSENMPYNQYYYRCYRVTLQPNTSQIVFMPYQVDWHGLSIALSSLSIQVDVSLSTVDTIMGDVNNGTTNALWVNNINATAQANPIQYLTNLQAVRFTNNTGGVLVAECLSG